MTHLRQKHLQSFYQSTCKVFFALLIATSSIYTTHAKEKKHLPMPDDILLEDNLSLQREVTQMLQSQESQKRQEQEEPQESQEIVIFPDSISFVTWASLWGSYASPIPLINNQQQQQQRTGRIYLVGSDIDMTILQGSFWEWSAGASLFGGVTENTIILLSKEEHEQLGGWIGASVNSTFWLQPQWSQNIRLGLGLRIGASAEALENQMIPHFPLLPFVTLEVYGVGITVGYVADSLLQADPVLPILSGESVMISLSHRFYLHENNQ